MCGPTVSRTFEVRRASPPKRPCWFAHDFLPAPSPSRVCSPTPVRETSARPKRQRPQGPAPAASGVRGRAPSACRRAAPRRGRSGTRATSTPPTASFTSLKVRFGVRDALRCDVWWLADPFSLYWCRYTVECVTLGVFPVLLVVRLSAEHIVTATAGRPVVEKGVDA